MKPGRLSIALAALALAGSQAAPTRAEHEGAALLAAGGFVMALHLSGVLDGHGLCAGSGDDADGIRRGEHGGRPGQARHSDDRSGTEHRGAWGGADNREPDRRGYGHPADQRADNPHGEARVAPPPRSWTGAPRHDERHGGTGPQYRQPPCPPKAEWQRVRVLERVTRPIAACRVLTGVGAGGRPAASGTRRAKAPEPERHSHR